MFHALQLDTFFVYLLVSVICVLLELLAGELVLWEPTHGRRGRGRPSATFIDTLKRDLGTDDKLELEVCMTNQEDWRARRAAQLRPP